VPYTAISIIEHIDGGQFLRSKKLVHACAGNPEQMRGRRDGNTNQLITVRSSMSLMHRTDRLTTGSFRATRSLWIRGKNRLAARRATEIAYSVH
jgi:hypothetical protein